MMVMQYFILMKLINLSNPSKPYISQIYLLIEVHHYEEVCCLSKSKAIDRAPHQDGINHFEESYNFDKTFYLDDTQLLDEVHYL